MSGKGVDWHPALLEADSYLEALNVDIISFYSFIKLQDYEINARNEIFEKVKSAVKKININALVY